MIILILEYSLSTLSLSLSLTQSMQKKREKKGGREWREREDVNLWSLMEKSNEGCFG